MRTQTFNIIAGNCDNSVVTLEVDYDVLTPEAARKIIQEHLSFPFTDIAGHDPVKAVIRLFGSLSIAYLLGIGGAYISADDEGDCGFDEGDCRFWTTSILNAQAYGWPAYEALGIKITEASVASVGYFDVKLQEAA
jgi:hypothetical protein